MVLKIYQTTTITNLNRKVQRTKIKLNIHLKYLLPVMIKLLIVEFRSFYFFPIKSLNLGEWGSAQYCLDYSIVYCPLRKLDVCRSWCLVSWRPSCIMMSVINKTNIMIKVCQQFFAIVECEEKSFTLPFLSWTKPTSN